MSKGKDFRAPRKRGFDDDGPMSYDSKPRSSRGFGGAPDSGGFGGPPMGGPSSAPINSSAPAVDALVKWFKADKGYGFVELAGGAGRRVPSRQRPACSGHDTVPAGRNCASRSARAPKARRSRASSKSTRPASSSGRNGPPATALRPRRVAPDPSTAISVTGKVKWFDDVKGFGFVASEDGGKDVFVHISILGPAGISHLAEGQQVNMRVVDTPKGREAISLSL